MIARRFQGVVRQIVKRSAYMSHAKPAMGCVMKVPAARFMSTDAGEHISLSEVLSSELQEEVQNDEINQEFLDIKSQISKTFKIQEEEGSGVVKLVHTNANETIEIVFDCQDEVEEQPEFDMEDEEAMNDMEEGDLEGSVGVKFHVTISKKHTDDKVVFFCVAGEQVNVENVQYLPAGKNVEDTTIYHGPVFDKLSDDLQDATLAYLSDRNIDEDMAFFIMSYSENKEQREYMNWLKKVMMFVDAK